MAGILFWYNSGSDDTAVAPAATAFNPNTVASTPASPARAAVVQRRSGAPANERNTLRLVPIDATRGDVDPTLRLDLLRKLSNIQQPPVTRSLFEAGMLAPADNPLQSKIKAPIIKVTDPTLSSFKAGPTRDPINTTVNIPLKYYGFVKPATSGSINSGLFLDGENVLVALEGEVVKGHYLVVELTPNSARMEDTQLKQGQTLPVVPVAAP